MLVIMALVTTFMAGPLLALLDPHNEFGAPVEEELDEARRESRGRSRRWSSRSGRSWSRRRPTAALEQLLALAEPLARSEPPRELILARLVRPPRRRRGARRAADRERRSVRQASREVDGRAHRAARRAASRRARSRSCPSTRATTCRGSPSSEDVDLLLIDGRRPLLGEGVPRGDVGAVLRDAPCDVGGAGRARGRGRRPARTTPSSCPFGGAEHDWAALELGAWIVRPRPARRCKLLGAAGQTDERPRRGRLLGDAGAARAAVRRRRGRAAHRRAGRGRHPRGRRTAPGLLVVGLSDRWREEGLGPTRSEIAKAAPAPVLFVRRGVRPGALAPRERRHALHLVVAAGWAI